MDILYFLTERMRFIRAFYDRAAAPFSEAMRIIEDGEPPFVPPYSEDGEPAFLDEWMEADTALEVLGRTCVSMLSDSLKLYFSTWEQKLGISCQKDCPRAFRGGFIHGYRACFEAAFGVSWADAPTDLDVIEQIILARNDAQHPDRITTLNVKHRGAISKFGRELFFARNSERAALSDPNSLMSMIMSPSLHVSRERLFAAIDEVEKFALWFDDSLRNTIYPGGSRR